MSEKEVDERVLVNLLERIDRIARRCDYPLDSALRAVEEVLLAFKERLESVEDEIACIQEKEGFDLEDFGIKQPVEEAIKKAMARHEFERHSTWSV